MRRSIAIAIVILPPLLVFAILWGAGVGGDGTILADGTVHFKQVLDFTEAGSFSVRYQHVGLDPEWRFFPYEFPHVIKLKGIAYIVYPEFFTLFGGMFLSTLGTESMFLATLLPCCVALWFAYLTMSELGFSNRAALLITLLYSFCTPLLIQSLAYTEVALSQMFAHCGLFFFVRFLNHTDRSLYGFISGVFWGLALFVRQEAAFAFAVLGLLYFFMVERMRFNRRVVYTALGFFLLLVLYLSYNFLLYGHPIGLRMANLSKEPVDAAGRFRIFFTLLFTGELWKSSGVGFFGQMPFLLLLFFKPIRNFRLMKPAFRLLFLYGVIFIILICTFAPNDGYLNIGSRFLMMGDLAMIAVFFHLLSVLRAGGKKWVRITTGFLIAWSVLFTSVGILAAMRQSMIALELRELVRRCPDKVVADLGGVSYWGGVVSTEKIILRAEKFAVIPHLAPTVEKAGMKSFCLAAPRYALPTGLEHVESVRKYFSGPGRRRVGLEKETKHWRLYRVVPATSR